ncbi:efflux RND transporter permease subunit [Alphaproteobacteria bacterium]|nr:efflux RND transporter permease subunit [Alphaproteobacteria bacterium]
MSLNIISRILNHKTAPNLFLMLMIFLGLFAAKQLNTQFFPNYSIDYISISIKWSGASTKDIEDSIIKPLENKVRYLDKVKSTRSTAREGLADVILEYETGTDMKNALNEVEREVNAITTFPEESDVPVIKLITPYEQIGLVLINGNSNENQLKKIAASLRDQLLNNGIDKIEIDGYRKQIIYIDLDPISLLSNKLDPEEVAMRIKPEIKNIPSGIFQNSSVVQLRTFSKKEKVIDLENIEMINKDGGKLKIKDIASVYETFSEKDSQGFSNGQKAITLKVFRSLGSDVLKNTKILENTVNEFQTKLNNNINIQIYDLSSQLIRDRINLLLKNGLGGLVLVLLILFLFLKLKVVIWVAIGIPAAISVTLAIMLLTGQSINMISLFALIMMLGIIVDDSIVVAEHIEYQNELGKSPSDAAYLGAIRMLGPVTAASLTTVAGFAPVFLISGVIGQVIEAIPLVVISVIIASLFECFLVLPGHIKMALIEDAKNSRKRLNLNKYLEIFKRKTFLSFLMMSIKHKYKTFFVSICLLIISFSLLKFSHVKFYFFPSPESQIILVNFSFSPGTLKKHTIEFTNTLDEKLKEIDNTKIVKTTYAIVGKPIWGSRISTKEFGDHVGGMIVELVSPEKREKRTNELIQEWKENIDLPIGLTSFTVLERKGGPPGLDIDIRIRSQNADLNKLKQASNFVQSELLKLKGVSDIKDNLPLGKREIEFTLTEKAESLDFNSNYLAKKIKAIFDGVSVTKFFRGEDEIEIIVRNNLDAMNINTFSSYQVLSPNGKLIPMSEIADMRKSQSFSTIKRNNGYREISVTGEINETLVNPDDIMKEIKENILKKLQNNFNLDWYLAGRAEEQKETFGDMKRGGFLAIGVIYIILAFIFQSYFLPFSIMSIIPFTLIGVIGGHWITGFDITILSLVAIFGLSGIVINDSIIMVSNIYEKIETGIDINSAIITGAQERLRAVMLTSLTTIAGLTPLLFEGSVQAQFLKPMAITIVFGLLFSTLLVLIFIPVILKIGEDIKKFLFNPKFWS